MRRRTIVIAVLAVVAVLAGATLAFGGPRGLIWDDGHYARPGTLDDGKDLLSQTTISLSTAVATAQQAASGALGQVDLEHFRGGIVYMVDIGNQEVRVDAATGKVVAVDPRG
ncbi:MAG TPA: PepSY domain-containing protein [Gaiellaceae bacterium]|jgi:uncharacterized membrane protein YkoI|nr:PepSY domain-containing protein [Gaiellaceae bacterium]